LGDKLRARLPTAAGTPSSSTSTGSTDAEARNCSTIASGNGIPQISAGPCSGTSTTNNGDGAAIGVSSCSATLTASHIKISASAARRFHGSRA
jgi:hypothetical protein